jgi:hypothetical protein
LALFAGFTLVIIEGVTGLVPTSALPDLADEARAKVIAGAGLWIMMIGSAVVVLSGLWCALRAARTESVTTSAASMSGASSSNQDASSPSSAEPLLAVLTGALVVVAASAVAVARLLPWIEWNADSRRVSTAGADIPVIHSLSLVVVVLIILCALALNRRPNVPIAAGIGVLCGSVAVSCVALIVGISVLDRAAPSFLRPDDVGDHAISSPGIGLWVGLVAGVLTMVFAVAHVATRRGDDAVPAKAQV